MTITNKRISGKYIIDAITLLVLAAAFVLCMVYGFLRFDDSGKARLSLGFLAAVSLVIPALLIISGSFSSFLARIRFSLLTKAFTWMFAAQIAAYIGMISLMLSLLLDVFEKGVSTPALPVFYLLFAIVFVVGYGESVLASEPMIALKQAEIDQALLEAEFDEEEESYDDESDDEDDLVEDEEKLDKDEEIDDSEESADKNKELDGESENDE